MDLKTEQFLKAAEDARKFIAFFKGDTTPIDKMVQLYLDERSK